VACRSSLLRRPSARVTGFGNNDIRHWGAMNPCNGGSCDPPLSMTRHCETTKCGRPATRFVDFIHRLWLCPHHYDLMVIGGMEVMSDAAGNCRLHEAVGIRGYVAPLSA